MKEMGKVTVVDSIMGSGKTSWAIQYMCENVGNGKRFIYVTPYLQEVESRILKKCPFMFQPDEKIGRGSKLRHFKQMVREGRNIATTHALFEWFDEEIFELLKGSGYTLILDEVFNVIKRMDITVSDVETAFKAGNMCVIDGEGADKHCIKWLKEDYDKGILSKVKFHAKNGNAYSHDQQILFWTFPAKMFEMFDHSYVLTYLFEGQIQAYYYKYHNVPYAYKAVAHSCVGYELCDYTGKDNRGMYKSLIDI